MQSFTPELPWQGNLAAKILVVVDPVVYKPEEGVPEGTVPLSKRLLAQLTPYMKDAGIEGKDLLFISACDPVEEDVWKSDSKLAKVVKADHYKFLLVFNKIKPRLIITQGKAAIRQVLDRPVKVTKIRGVAFRDEKLDTLVMPMLGIAHVARVPEHGELFLADLLTASRLIKRGFVLDEEKHPKNYQWCTDLGFMLKNRPKLISVDLEASTFTDDVFPHWYDPRTKVLTVQLSYRAGESFVVPIDYPGYPIGSLVRKRLIHQLRCLLEDVSVKIIGQNFKSDWMLLWHVLKIKVANYSDDVLLLAYHINENMLSKALDDIARIHLLSMAGYKDEFIRKGYDYGRMDLVKPEDMLEYSGADSDAVLQLFPILEEKLKSDPRHYNCYRRITFPAMRAFCDVEQEGFHVNKVALRALHKKVSEKQAREETRLFAMIPESIKKEYRDTGVGLKLTRQVLLRAFLFDHKDGLRLKPLMFTKGTKLASTSTKLHLPFFIGRHPFIYEAFIKPDGEKEERGYIPFAKNETLLNTFIGEEKENTGFWKYIFDDHIYPSYLLHRTTTGRTASVSPNGQNIPKRGEFAKDYRAIFEENEDDWVYVEADYSQIELRLVGIAAHELTFLKLYRSGGDIHCMTAAQQMGITLEAFMNLKTTDPERYEMGRYRAKVINFGFIYGLGWKKFIVYAKTEYGISYSETEAKNARETFFNNYRFLQWHEDIRNFVREHGYVRSFVGWTRHLPAVVVDDDGIRSSAERQAINSPIQQCASSFGEMALTRMNQDFPKDFIRPNGFVHDAVINRVRASRVMEAARLIKYYMESNPLQEWFGWSSPIPIVADIKIGKNLSKMLEIKDSLLSDKSIVTYDDLMRATVSKKANLPKLSLSKKQIAR